MNLNRVLWTLSIVLLAASIAVAVNAQSSEPDRISFYNDPADNKLESHVDYADSHSAHIRYGACTPGTVIEEALNLYTARFSVEGCTADIHQHLNLRWVGGCVFDMEHDPDTRIEMYGDYGQATITGHYDQGEVTLDVPVGTITMTAVMSHTVDGELWTGNVEYLFDDTIGCVDAPVTPTATATPTATPTATATSTITSTTIDDTVPTPTATPTEIVVIDDATPTMTEIVIVCCPDVPVTETPTPIAPTALTPESEPGRMVFLPVVSR